MTIEIDLDALDRSELTGALEKCSTSDLIRCLNDRSSRVGDSAFDALCRRGQTTIEVAQALLSGVISRKPGKIRALNYLLRFGLKAPEAVEVYLAMLYDRSEDVASTALFGLVFFQDTDVLGPLIEWRSQLPKKSRLYTLASKAISALECGEPGSFSPFFKDRAGVWKRCRP